MNRKEGQILTVKIIVLRNASIRETNEEQVAPRERTVSEIEVPHM